MRSCIFCGSSPTTKEHVLPAWLSSVLPGEGDFGLERSHERFDGEITGGHWQASALNLTVRCACAACNHGWMSELEGHAKPLLVPMIQGRPSSLSRAALTTIAL